MGSFFSTVLTAVDGGTSLIPSTAMVVATDGSLLEYSGGIRASEVIMASGQVYVLCNSDKLFFDAYPPATAPDKVLVPGQIYYLLPVAELRQRLSGANVSDLAYRASAAMKRASEKKGRRRKIRVVPVAEVFDVEVGDGNGNLNLRLTPATTEMKKKGIVGVGSKRLRMVLSTIKKVDEE